MSSIDVTWKLWCTARERNQKKKKKKKNGTNVDRHLMKSLLLFGRIHASCQQDFCLFQAWTIIYNIFSLLLFAFCHCARLTQRMCNDRWWGAKLTVERKKYAKKRWIGCVGLCAMHKNQNDLFDVSNVISSCLNHCRNGWSVEANAHTYRELRENEWEINREREREREI